MASRNVSGGDASAGSDSDTEVTTTLSKAKPLVNYGDRMPYRQGIFPFFCQYSLPIFDGSNFFMVE